MSSTAPAVVSGFGRTRRWATAGTSASGELVDIPITSENASPSGGEAFFGVFEYANLGRALPPTRGMNALLETTLEQLSAFTDAVVGSGISALSEHMMSPCFYLVAHGWGRRSSQVSHYHETLDWDAFIERPPGRKSGTITVSLTYAGRAKPIAIEDPWE